MNVLNLRTGEPFDPLPRLHHREESALQVSSSVNSARSRGMLLAAKSFYVGGFSVIPNAYRLVKSLNGNGSAYLKVDMPNGNNYIRVRVGLDGYTKKTASKILGWYSGGAANYRKGVNIECYYDMCARVYFAYTQYNSVVTSYPATLDVTISQSVDRIVKNGDLYLETTETENNTYNGFNYLFALDYYGSRREGVSYNNISEFEYWTEESTLYSHLLPCVRKSDEKPGMYDVVRKAFFTNESTTGDDFGWTEIG